MRPGALDGSDSHADLRERLRHVYWLGGGSGGGKSTIARRIAAQHDLQVYGTDDVMPDHARRLTPEEAPYLDRFKDMSMDERWVERSPESMLDTFHWFRGEGFDLVIQDLLRLPSGIGVVAEGFRLLPHLVEPLLSAPDHAVWILPTPEFRRAALDSRRTTWDIPSRTTRPERARRNLLERDGLFTDRLRREAGHRGLPVIDEDVGMTEDELAARVVRAWGL